jgi:predicted Zn-dependent protease
LALRDFVRSFVVLLFFSGWLAFGQSSAPDQAQQVPAAPATAPQQALAPEVADAEAAIVKSDWTTAEQKLTPYVATHPDDARALFDAGYVADAQNRLNDAAALYRRSVEANPKSFEAQLMLGLLLARQGKLADARPELAAATTLDAGDAGPGAKARAWRALAQVDRTTDPTQASTDLLEALKLTPETVDDTLLAAELADQTGEYDAAEKVFRRVLAEDPKSAAANAGLAHLLIARKQYPEAETMLRAALEQSPEDAALTAQLATVLVAENKAEALPLLEKLHDDHPDDATITGMLAQVLAESGDSAGSDRLYRSLIAANPNDASLWIAHGQNLVRELKFVQALGVFDKATQLAPANADGWSGMAFAASKTNQPSITLHALTMRSKYLPENASTYFLWATAYDTLHNKASAAVYYHHFLDAAGGKFPNEEWQAKQRLIVLEKKP